MPLDPTTSEQLAIDVPLASRVLLKGLPGSGKSMLLLSAVLWARSNGWLVLYWPRGRDWTDGGVYHPHPHPVREAGEGKGESKRLWDTPVQAMAVLKVRTL